MNKKSDFFLITNIGSGSIYIFLILGTINFILLVVNTFFKIFYFNQFKIYF